MGDLGSIPGLGRYPGEGNGYPLQYSGLENSMNRGTWQAIVHGAAKSQTQLSDSHFTSLGLSVQTESWQRLTEFCQENTLILTNTLFEQHKQRFYTWASPDAQHRNQIDYIFCSRRQRSSMESAKTRPGADHGSDYELFIVKIRLKLKKIG